MNHQRILVRVRTGTSGSWHVPVKSQCYLRFIAKIPTPWYWFGMPVLIHFRDMSLKVFLAGLIFVTPMVLQAQRFGFSIGTLGSQSTGAIPGGGTTPSAPPTPPLTPPLPPPSLVQLPPA